MTPDLDRIIEGLSEAELLEEFRALFTQYGPNRRTARSWARENGLTTTQVSYVLNEQRRISERIANALGYDRVVRFVPRQRLKEMNDAS